MSHSPSSVCPACFSWQQGWRPAPVCWELIDSASSLAKGPAMVLSLCPACSRAGGVGRDTRSSGKMEVWLEGTDWKRREGGGGGGGLEWKREFGRGWTRPERGRPAWEVTPPPPTATGNHNPKSSTRRDWSDPLWHRSIPVFLVQLAQIFVACRQPEPYFWI